MRVLRQYISVVDLNAKANEATTQPSQSTGDTLLGSQSVNQPVTLTGAVDQSQVTKVCHSNSSLDQAVLPMSCSQGCSQATM